MNRDDLQELLGDDECNAILYDGFDDAILGVASRINLGPVVAYDYNKVIDIMVERDGMDYEDAVEHYHNNIIGGWLGEGTPIFIEREFEEYGRNDEH